MNKKILVVISCLVFISLLQNVQSIENEGSYELIDKLYEKNEVIENEKWDIMEFTEGAMDTQGFSLVNTPTDYHCINNFTGRDLPIKISANAPATEGIYKTYTSISVFSAWFAKADTKSHYFFIGNVPVSYTGGFYLSGSAITFMSWTGSSLKSGSTDLSKSINSNEWYHVLFAKTGGYIYYYINAVLYAKIIDTPYNIGNSIYMASNNGGSGTSTAYFDDIYIGNSTEDAFRSYYNSKHYVNNSIDISVDSNQNIYHYYANISIQSNITQSSTTYIYNNCSFEEFEIEIDSYFNHYVDYTNKSIFLIESVNETNSFELNITINILITYLEFNETIEEGGITIDNIINIILMNQEFILLIVLIALSLYTSNKYPNAIWLNSFWLFTVSIFGVYVMATLEEYWFALIIVLFNAILNMAFIAKNYDRRK